MIVAFENISDLDKGVGLIRDEQIHILQFQYPYVTTLNYKYNKDFRTVLKNII
jgi:hypothetical protein